MTIDAARKWLIVWSLIITGAQMLFFIIAPATGFPLSYPKNFNLLQIVSPIFLGYLGAASHFIFQSRQRPIPVQSQYLGLLVRGPILTYAILMSALLASFGYSNRAGAVIGTGMSIDSLSTGLSICLGLLAATTSVVSSYLFTGPRARGNSARGPLIE